MTLTLSGMRPRARSIQLKFPEIPVQNQIERPFSKRVFRKFWTASGGCPFIDHLPGESKTTK